MLPMLKDLPFKLEKVSKRFVSLKYVQRDSYYYEREGLMIDPCCQKDTKVYHILYTTAKQRREAIEGIVYGSTGIEPHISGTSMWFLLMSLYRLRKKDPFKFVCMIPNATIETIEVTGKVIKSIRTQTYVEVESQYIEKLRELGYELPDMHT
jgi:hypothetical protein